MMISKKKGGGDKINFLSITFLNLHLASAPATPLGKYLT